MAASTIPNKKSKAREFITPEGVALTVNIASAGSRIAALTIDLIIMLLILIAITLLAIFGGIGDEASFAAVVWLLGFFVLRNGYFLLFELGKRAATPGKRLVGIRVIASNGDRLTADAVVARNLIRELEIFLPLTFLAYDEGTGAIGGVTMVLGLAWSLCLSLFLLFNRDRMRVGDLIAGTWVVDTKRRKLANALTATTESDDLGFSKEELSVYGIFELQELERIVRENDPKVMANVADTIRVKIGRPFGDDDATFLNGYYRALKAHLERDLLFGKRRENKFDEA